MPNADLKGPVRYPGVALLDEIGFVYKNYSDETNLVLIVKVVSPFFVVGLNGKVIGAGDTGTCALQLRKNGSNVSGATFGATTSTQASSTIADSSANYYKIGDELAIAMTKTGTVTAMFVQLNIRKERREAYE